MSTLNVAVADEKKNMQSSLTFFFFTLAVNERNPTCHDKGQK